MAGRLRALVARIAIDVEPLRAVPEFRRLWIGLGISELGYQFTLVATFVQVYDLTGSPAAVGIIGAVGFVALTAGTLIGSAFIDHHDRRSLLVLSQLGFMVAAGTLLLGSLVGDPPVVLVYGAVALMGLVSAIDSPTRQALTPPLVGRERLPAAFALNQVTWNTTALLGPALAGIVISRTSVAWAYGFDLLTYLAMLWAAIRLRPFPPDPRTASARGFAAVREGFAFLRGRPVVQASFGIDIIAMAFGMPRALFPILALTQFRRGPEVVGLLFAAPAVGALLGTLTAGWVGRVRKQGVTVVWAVIAWGACITSFGLVGERLIPALVLLALAGAADVISALVRQTILQSSAPDALRGRVSAIYILVVTGGPRIGDLEAGLVAQAFSPAVSVVSGGIACIVGALAIAALVPSFRRYTPADAIADPAGG